MAAPGQMEEAEDAMGAVLHRYRFVPRLSPAVCVRAVRYEITQARIAYHNISLSIPSVDSRNGNSFG